MATDWGRELAGPSIHCGWVSFVNCMVLTKRPTLKGILSASVAGIELPESPCRSRTSKARAMR